MSILDPIACARLVFDNGRLPHFLAKQSVFKGFAGTLLRGAGQIPVARFSADAHAALDAAKADLDAGNVIVIYPEGSVTRDPDWWPMQPRTGVARLALTTDAVVVPVAQWGPQRLHDYHSKKLQLRFRAPADYLLGEPVDLVRAAGRGARRPAAGRRPAARDDRYDHGPGARPARRAARGARAADVPPAPAARAARRRVRDRRVTRAAVLGAGSWGTTFAKVLADAGCEVTLHARRPSWRRRSPRTARTATTCPASGCPTRVRATADPGRRCWTPRSSSSPCRPSRCGTT